MRKRLVLDTSTRRTFIYSMLEEYVNEIGKENPKLIEKLDGLDERNYIIFFERLYDIIVAKGLLEKTITDFLSSVALLSVIDNELED